MPNYVHKVCTLTSSMATHVHACMCNIIEQDYVPHILLFLHAAMMLNTRSETIKAAINHKEITEIQQEWSFCASFEAKIIIFTLIISFNVLPC